MRPASLQGAGLGLFTRVDLRPRELVAAYEGEEIDLAEFQQRYVCDENGDPRVPPQHVFCVDEANGIFIDAADPALSNEARWANHQMASRANCVFGPRGVLRVGDKRIKAGSELTVAYGGGAIRTMRAFGLLPPPKRRKGAPERADRDDTTAGTPPAQQQPARR